MDTKFKVEEIIDDLKQVLNDIELYNMSNTYDNQLEVNLNTKKEELINLFYQETNSSNVKYLNFA